MLLTENCRWVKKNDPLLPTGVTLSIFSCLSSFLKGNSWHSFHVLPGTWTLVETMPYLPILKVKVCFFLFSSHDCLEPVTLFPPRFLLPLFFWDAACPCLLCLLFWRSGFWNSQTCWLRLSSLGEMNSAPCKETPGGTRIFPAKKLLLRSLNFIIGTNLKGFRLFPMVKLFEMEKRKFAFCLCIPCDQYWRETG